MVTGQIHLIGFPPEIVVNELESYYNYPYKVLIELQLRTKLQYYFAKLTYWCHKYDRSNLKPINIFGIDDLKFMGYYYIY